MGKREREYRQRGEGWDGRRCEICGARAGIQHHHRTPHAQGGDDSDENIQPLCPGCHAQQGGPGHNLAKYNARGIVFFQTILTQREYAESRATQALTCEVCGLPILIGEFVYVGGGGLEACRPCLEGIRYQYEAREVKARKPHVCGICGQEAVQKGQVYFHVFQQRRCCGPCVDAEYRQMYLEEMRHWFGDDYGRR